MPVLPTRGLDDALSVRFRDRFGEVSGRVHPPVADEDADRPALITFGPVTMSIGAARQRARALLWLIMTADGLNRKAARRRARDANLSRMGGARAHLPVASARR